MYQEKGLYLPYNEILKKAVNVPVITAGRMEDPDLASNAIKDGKTDMIGLARPLLADPHIPNKIKKDKVEDIRPCLSCQEGCMGRLASFATVSCAVNPACGREIEYDIEPTRVTKKVAIIGGGVAGCEAARVCAIRGHKVTLFEKTDRLGGNLIPGGVPDFKEDDMRLVKWYERELKKLEVDVKFNNEVTKEILEQVDTDVVIVSTGSTPKMLNIDNCDKVYTAEEVLLGKKDVGDTTIIIGGGLVGCETALWLADQGKKVTIVEMQKEILEVGGPLCHANKDMLKELIPFKNIDLKTGAMVASATEDGFIVATGEEKELVKADSVIVSIGYNSQKQIYDEVKNSFEETYLLGDARKVQNIMYAIWDAYEIAKNI